MSEAPLQPAGAIPDEIRPLGPRRPRAPYDPPVQASTRAVPGYEVREEIYRGRARLIYRAVRERDGLPVVLKTFVDEFPSRLALAGLRREHDILVGLDIDGVPRAYDLVASGRGLTLILEDIDGERLRRLIAESRIDLPGALRLGVGLAGIIGELHRRNVIHRDINSNNVLVERGTGRPVLTDFSLASRLAAAQQSLAHPNVLEGTIAYLSPEQTGRMNRDIDYRTDIYSAGVTLYETLTGRLPFESDDPLEVVYCHIARAPVPPREVDPRIPGPLSDIVMKALAKTPEDRYQSAFGLRGDLLRCLTEWESTRRIVGVRAGESDVPDRFVVPQRLYGRDRQVEELLGSFEAACDGAVTLTLVSGYSGIGKTSLIHEVHRALTHRRGYFIQGKFDQLVRNVPYSALAEAFRGLIRQLLTESEEAVRRWRDELLGSLGRNAGVIIDVIPELEGLLGEQPPVPSLGPAESQNRFNLLLQKFLGTFASEAHPLVLFLDDLQWADSATLKLLKTFLANRELRGLLVIGAYRDNEVSDTHPLLLTISDIRESGTPVREISLGPLGLGDLTRFIADTLHTDTRRVAPLARRVQEKTDGNPFFVTQFLKTLHQEGLVFFDYEAVAWQFDLDQIERMEMTDNVADLMASKIERLPPSTREILKLAACIGGTFDLATLSTVSELTPRQAATELWQALERGLVLPLGDPFVPGAVEFEDWQEAATFAYRFLHDRVQHAAYALIPEEAKRRVHLTIGRLLLAGTAETELEERIFDLVDQLDYGIDLITDRRERRMIAGLNVTAGQKARTSAAYRMALNYFQAAARLLGEESWGSEPEDAFRVHLAMAECEYLCGDFADAEDTCSLLLRRAVTPLQAAEVHRLRVVQYENQSRYRDAIDAASRGLEPFGIRVPKTAREKSAALDAEIEAIRSRLGDRPIEGLTRLRVMDDPRVKMCMRLLMEAWASAYIAGDADLIAWIPARMVRLSLEHGNTEESATGYVLHGITVGTRLGDFATGHEFGRLALQINEDFDDLASRAKVHEMFSCFVNLWRQPLRTCFTHSRISYQAGLESGDFTFATYAIFHESWYALLTSRDLASFHKAYASTVEFLRQIKMYGFADAQQLILQWSLALRGLTRSPVELSGDEFDEADYSRRWALPFFEVFRSVARLHLLYLMGEHEAAREEAARAEKVIGSLQGTIWPALLQFYQGLTLTALHDGLDTADRRGCTRKLRKIEGQLAVWAENAPENFRHRHRLIAAEIARIEGRHDRAVELFERAIESAETADFLQDRALAHELYGRFWLERGQHRIAASLISTAYGLYRQWGATAKERDLAERYPAFIRDLRDDRAPAVSALATTEAGGDALDFETVMKAAEAIAGEIELTRLLEKLLRILIENAAARRGVLILPKDDEWRIEAEGTIEDDRVQVLQSVPVTGERVPAAVVNYVRRTGESVVLADAAREGGYATDPYILRVRPPSILCTAVLNQGRVIGVVYLENDMVSGAFTPERIRIVQMLSSHAAIAINNAELFAEVSDLRDRLQAENIYLQEEIQTQRGFEEIIGESDVLKKVLQQVEQVAPTDATVLITGETGTGKELIARAIHSLSGRRDGPLITVNCGAISSGLVESELFGHEKGAFTGAVGRKVGRFELATGGTIFLDEIGDLPLDLQVRLLRVLQEGEIQRVGGTQTVRVDVRVIAATHHSLSEAVGAGRFREDLYYRLEVFPIHVPALRERSEDIPRLVRYFVMQYALKMGKRIETIPKKTMDALVAYPWPGNIRELRNVIERSVILTTGTTLKLGDWAVSHVTGPDGAARTLEDVEREHILEVVTRTGWRVSGPQGAARLLGMKPTTLESRMKKLGIQRPR